MHTQAIGVALAAAASAARSRAELAPNEECHSFPTKGELLARW